MAMKWFKVMHSIFKGRKDNFLINLSLKSFSEIFIYTASFLKVLCKVICLTGNWKYLNVVFYSRINFAIILLLFDTEIDVVLGHLFLPLYIIGTASQSIFHAVPSIVQASQRYFIAFFFYWLKMSSKYCSYSFCCRALIGFILFIIIVCYPKYIWIVIKIV